MICGACGRDYFPKQRWVHEPCRYVGDVVPNHVPVHARGTVVVETEVRLRLGETETEGVVETAWGKLGLSRATYFRKKAAGEI